MLTRIGVFRRAASSPSAASLSFSDLSPPPLRLDATSYFTSRSLLVNMGSPLSLDLVDRFPLIQNS